MKYLATTTGIIFLLVFLRLVLPIPADALEHSFLENFHYRAYCDSVNTTAWWHSLGEIGELKLWPFHMDVVGNLPFPDQRTSGVAVSGNHAYVTIRGYGLRVIDISDPGNPVQIGGCATSGAAYAVAVDGDYAYVADGLNGLRVIDISNPSSPAVVGGYGEGVDYRGVTISGDYAYVAAGAAGLVVINISNPASPTLAGQRDTPGFALEVAVSGDYAYVADNGSGMQIIGISDPAHPDSVVTYATPDSAKGVVVSGDCAFVAVYNYGLEVVGITNPVAPFFKGRRDTPGTAIAVDVTGDYAYVADGPAGLQAIDISEPTEPTWKDGCPTSDFATKVVVCGEYAYVTDRLGGFKVIHIADATLPPLWAGNLAISVQGQAVDIAGDYAYLVTGSNFLVVNIRYPSALDTVGSFGPVTGTLTDVAVSGDYAYVTALSYGLWVLDISNPDGPFVAGSCPDSGGCNGVAVVGDYAYLAAGTAGLVVVNISNPAHPVVAGSCGTSGYAYNVAVSGDYAYVADGTGGLAIIDITSPTSPVPVTSFATSDIAHGVDVSGDLAYVAAGAQGLVIVNISSPQSPSLVSVCDISGSAHSVVVIGRHAFVCRYLALYVVNVRNPGSPTIVGSYPTQAECYGIAISGDYAFLPEDPVGLEVVQVYQRQFDLQRNQGQSLVFFASEQEISAARVFTAQADSIYWYVSADSGANWTYVPTDDQWHPLDPPGHALLWRSRHFYRIFGENPTCSTVEIEWKYSFAEIDSVKDVPEDEGGWVRVRFNRSGLDFAGGGGGGREGSNQSGGSKTSGGPFGATQTGAISTYFTHRRVDDIGAIGKLFEKGKRVEPDKPVTMNVGDGTDTMFELPSSMGGAQAYVMDGHSYYVSEGSGGFPPGIWETVGGVPATQQEQYYSLVPTVADSMSTLRYTVYCVTAHTGTPTAYYISPPDSGYSRDNLPPRQPTGLKGDYGYPPPKLFMSWGRNSEKDFSHYSVYKGTSEDFVPNETNRIGTPWDTSFVDNGFDPNLRNYYKVSAWDIHENQGVFSLLRPEDITSVGTPPAVPAVTMLEQNMPNPFNPATVIRFSILQAGWVVLRVYDVAGRPVRTLVDGVRSTGWYEARWDGRDDYEHVVPSGVYLYKLTAPWYAETRKMVLIK
jgi:hypothetical protein